MKNNRGFTIIEISMVMVILGIMAAFTLVKYRSTVVHNELEKTANNIYVELRAIRATVFKWDTQVIVKFYQDSICSWVDTNGNARCDNNDIHKVIKFPVSVAIGRPVSPPTKGPYNTTIPSSGLTGDWADSLKVLADTRGDYSHGTACIYSRKLSKITYCIGIDTAMQSLEFYKWIDNSWKKL
jgi:prepilin-type N-terminal cleavage/methylation domain-containing protein